MYKIFADDTLIYDSTFEDYSIEKGVVTLETNKSGSFVFSIYPDHFYYDNFVRLKTVITVYKSGKIIFRGRILNDVTDYWNNKKITCEGELGFLNDSIIRPFTFFGYPDDLLQAWINDHNAQVDEFKHFKLGTVTVTANPNGYIERSDEKYKSTLTSLTDHLTKVLSGYLYITHGEDGTDPIPTLNYLADFDNVSTQTIEFGSNLKNYTKTVKADEIATAIIPLGAEIDDEDSETPNPKLTIERVNNGLDYVYSPTGVALYGWIFKTVSFDDITSEYELKRKAEEYLDDILGQKITISLNAVDLHLLDPTIDSISVGEYVRAVSTPHNMDITLLCSGQTIDLLKPENDSFTLGYSYTTASELNNDFIKNITSNYITNRRFVNELSKAISLIAQTEERIRLEVESTYVKTSELDSFEERTLSQIAVERDNILLSVSGTYSTKDEVTSEIASVQAQVDNNTAQIDLVTQSVTESNTTLAEIKQKTDDNSASIALVVQNGEVSGGILIEAINGDTTVKINADKLETDNLVVKDSITSDGEASVSSLYVGDISIEKHAFVSSMTASDIVIRNGGTLRLLGAPDTIADVRATLIDLLDRVKTLESRIG